MTFNKILNNVGIAIGSLLGYAAIAIGITMVFLLLKTLLFE